MEEHRYVENVEFFKLVIPFLNISDVHSLYRNIVHLEMSYTE
jgi:hypothetical protein